MRFREPLQALFSSRKSQQTDGSSPDEILQGEFQRLRGVDPETDRQWLRLQQTLTQRPEIVAARPRPIPRFAVGVAVVALAAVGAYLSFTLLSPTPDIFTTGVGEQIKVDLSDGSRLTLNYATEVVVPKLRQGEPRRVSLEGEAYFRVERNETPFVISTRYAQVEVVGTEFNLRAREGTLEVAVVGGTVNVRVEKDGKDSTLQLTRNQRAVCPQNDFPARVGDIPSEEYPGWLYGKLFLDGTPLLTACREIEMRFNITIRLQHQRLGSEIITGILDAGNAESAVAALCELTGTRYRQENREYTMYSTQER